MVCKVCRHPQLEEIDEALVVGTSIRDIAGQFQLKRSSLQRHQKHLVDTLRKAHEAEEIGRADSLIDQLKRLQEDARRIASKAEKSRKYHAALAGVRELTRLLQVAMRISEQAVADNKDVSPMQSKLCRHAAHIMCAMYKADDRIVLVITEKQATELAERIREIYGIRL